MKMRMKKHKQQQRQIKRRRTTTATTTTNQQAKLSIVSPLPCLWARNYHLLPRLILVCTFVIYTLNISANAVVVHQVRFIENKTGRVDYALTGETIELSCHYMMKDEAEDVKQVIWSKDGKNFLRWRKFKPGLEVFDYTFKGHFDPSSVNSHLIIHNVTIEMHGTYKCQIKTDLGVHEMENDLIVISQNGCKLNDWRVVSEQTKCNELFRLDCRNMFPRPVPSCGLWNSKLDKFIRSVTVDISEEPGNKETYRVRYLNKFDLLNSPGEGSGSSNDNNSIATTNANLDLLQYAGHLMFKCDIVVPETSWKLSLTHQMFDYSDGCNENPLEAIEQMRSNFSHYATARMQQAGLLNAADRRHRLDDVEMLTSSSGSLKYELMPSIGSKTKKIELNCWRKPRVGTLARLSCAGGGGGSKNNNHQNVKLIGANFLECRPNGWVPIMVDDADKGQQQQQQSSRNKSTNNTMMKKIPRKHRSNNEATASSSSPANDDTEDLNNKMIISSPKQQRHREELTSQAYSNDLQHRLDATANHDEDDDNSMSSNSNEVPTINDEPIPSTKTTTSTTTTIPITESSLSGDEQPTTPMRDLTPAQLAALLPSCVSINSHRNRLNNKFRYQGGDNKLSPPMDEAVVLEAYSQGRDKSVNQHHPSSRYRSDNNQQEDGGPFEWIKFFSSSSSSSPPSFIGSLNLVLCLLVSILLTSSQAFIRQRFRLTG